LHIVIDKNMFSTPDLERWLLSDPENIAVLPRHAPIECFSGKDPEKNARLSFTVLSKYPNQVVVAKPSQELMLLASVEEVPIEQLIDHGETESVRERMNWLSTLPAGREREYFKSQNKVAMEILQENEETAARHRSIVVRILQGWKFPEAIARAKAFEKPTDEDISRMIEFGIEPLAKMYLPEFPFQPHRIMAMNTKKYKFRWATAFWWLLWDRMARLKGPDGNINSTKFASDLIDIEYIAPSTCFDGYWSDDGRAFEIYKRTNGTIRGLINSRGVGPA
jgi:hypothetical protein